MKKLFILFAMVLSVSAVFAAEVTVDFDADVDFSKYDSFHFGNYIAPDNDLFIKRMKVGLEEQLTDKGLEKKEKGEGKLRVVFIASTRVKKEVDVQEMGYTYRRTAWRGSVAVIDVKEVNVGTLIVDLIDAETNELVWRGVAKGTLSSEPEKNQKKIKKSLDKMFKKYPEL